MRKKLLSIILVLTFLVTCFAGCRTSVDKQNKISELEDFVALTEVVDGRPDVYVIVKSMTSSYWKVVLKGAQAAGEKWDCNVYAAGSKLETEWQVQEEYIKKAMDQGADGIILGPDSSVKLADIVDQVYEAGIPIVIVDTIVNTENYDVCYMTDNLLAGENAALEMISQFRRLGYNEENSLNVAIQLGARESQTINERLAGFCQYWTNHAPDNWTLEEEIICNDGDEDKAVALSKEYLLNHPEVNGVFGTDNASSMGYSSAIMSLGKKDIVMIGFDYSPEVAQIVEDGEYNVSVMLQNQYNMGYEGVKSVLSLIEGQKSELKFRDTGVEVLNSQTSNNSKIKEIIKVNKGL